MNVRLEHRFRFLANVFANGYLQVNEYDVELSMITASEDGTQYSLAMDRLMYFVEEIFENCIFVGHEDAAIELLSALGTDVVELPDVPVDQIIGMMLFCKLNAIMEQRMVIYSVGIQSRLGSHVKYLHSAQEPLGPFESDGWWHSHELNCFDVKLKNTQSVVEIKPTESWKDIGLGWDDEPVSSVPGEVVFAKFNKDEN